MSRQIVCSVLDVGLTCDSNATSRQRMEIRIVLPPYIIYNKQNCEGGVTSSLVGNKLN
jgi:hypothetical protein